MHQDLHDLIVKRTGASSAVELETIQELWSGYGKIKRIGLKGADFNSIIVKHVQLPQQQNHPRGWNTDTSLQRKMKSHQIGTNGKRLLVSTALQVYP